MMAQLLFSFMKVGLLSVGGGYAAIPIIREQTVGLHAWLTMQEFADLVTIAEMTPGPIMVNVATFVGMRLAGVVGAVVATLGCILPSAVLLSAMALVYTRYQRSASLARVLSILRCAVAALIAEAGLGMARAAALSGEEVLWRNLLLFAGALALLRGTKCSPVKVIVLSGVAGLLLKL